MQCSFVKIYKSKRAALSEKERVDLSIEITNQCLKLPIWEFEHFHIFLPIEAQKEVLVSDTENTEL